MAFQRPAHRALCTLSKRRRICPSGSSTSTTIRNASTASIPNTTASSEEHMELEPSTFSNSALQESVHENFNPEANSSNRSKQLPPSRYQYRPPKYYRGPLHPHQPPPTSDPASREFIPGPFSAPRLEQTYQSTIASDLMTMSYQHFPPGYEPPPKAPRLREWDGSSPYHKNRPLRGPRGGDVLSLLRRRITFRNVPKIEGVVVHSFVREAMEDNGALHVAAMAVQAITGQRVRTHPAKHNEVRWGLRAGKYISLTSEIRGEDMYHFLSKLVDVVLPRIRDYKGVKGTTGDDNGNLSLGLVPEVVALFPEVEINYDSYPPKLIPGCHITIQTSATTDRDARLLLMAMGFPFTGKLVN